MEDLGNKSVPERVEALFEEIIIFEQNTNIRISNHWPQLVYEFEVGRISKEEALTGILDWKEFEE